MKLLGYEEKELVGQPVGRILAEEKDLIQKGVEQDVEKTYMAKDGRKIPMSFSNAVMRDDNGMIQGVVYVAQDITERKQAEEKIKAALAEKEVLLKEVHHRVKNNLQVLIYLIDMQAETIEDPKVLQILEELQGRAWSMSLVHEKLYQSEDLALINFGDYLRELTANLFRSLGEGRGIAMNVNAENLFINVNIAIPCGMIVNELVTNALKYAFPNNDVGASLGPRPEIRVEFREKEGEYVLIVSDNGVGLPSELDWRKTESLGLKLVNIWAGYQLGGSIEVDTSNGTEFVIRFPQRK